MLNRSPFFWALAAGLAVLAAAFAPVAWQMLGPSPAPPPQAQPAPWQIGRGAHGELQAFGLRLPGSTLADAAARWPQDLQVALIASRQQPLALEAYVERWSGGGVEGRLVLAAQAPAAALERWQQQAARHDRIDANAQRWTLRAEDHAEALRSPVTGLTFMPSGRVDAATLEQRFGSPAERLADAGAVQQWLYPDKGLAIAWQPERGRAVLQVVAPAEFNARLRAPLAAAADASAAERTR